MSLLLSALLYVGGASAAQYFYQPAANTSVLNLEAGYRNGQSTFSDGGGANTITGLYRTGATYRYGLNEAVSLGGRIAYSDLERKTNGKGEVTGLEPIEIDLRGRAPVGALKFAYGVAVSAGAERPRLNEKGNVNRSWGDPIDGYNRGLNVSGTVGAIATTGPSEYGAFFSADVYRADTRGTVFTGTQRGDVSLTFSKGNRSSLVAFYEYTDGSVLLGADLGWIKQWETRIQLGNSSDTEPGFGMLGADLYARVQLSPSGALVPRVSVFSRDYTDDDPAVEDYRFALAYQLTF